MRRERKFEVSPGGGGIPESRRASGVCISRRHFIETTALSGLGLAAGSLLTWDAVATSKSRTGSPPGATGERIAGSTAALYRPYRSRAYGSAAATTWAQIDLGSSQSIDAVKLYPSNRHDTLGSGFPARFRIECSDDPAFQTRQPIADWSTSDYPHPGDRIVQFAAKKAQGRHVRITATKLSPETFSMGIGSGRESYVFALTKIEVISAGADVAAHRSVTVDTALGSPADAQQLTRAPRPQGEGVITNNSGNVTSPEYWRAVAYRAQVPATDLQIGEGLFRTAVDNNIDYLLNSASVDDLLLPFRQRAGKPVPAPTRKPHFFWDDLLPGSSAGRFLMGAANTLHWVEHAELRRRMNAVVDGIAHCRQSNGYIMAYPEEAFFDSEHGAYERAWVTHGLLDAAGVGNSKALDLLRGYYDWYNAMPYLPEALRRCGFGPQGMVANTRLYFTSVGKAADVQVLQRYFQENYWLADLAARRPHALWQYPYDRPHGYLLTLLEAYLDLYRATGDERYLQAVLGAWELFREHWQATGGTIALIEFTPCPPGSRALHDHLGETCCSAFWVLLNQRLHLLDPEEEKYVAEIEKSIYNVLLANQDGGRGIRYHSVLVGRKDRPTNLSTCCEGQGTRLLASLPQFIYSIADEGVYVNLFESSSIAWSQAGAQLRLEMHTDFPRDPKVRLSMHASSPTSARIRIRVPSWAAGVMDIEVNRAHAGTGRPGSYHAIDRVWSDRDEITFTLPMAFKLTKYTGIDQIQGRERFALEYGPLLMAAVGAADAKLTVRRASSPQELLARLQSTADRQLSFTLSDPMTRVMADVAGESEIEFRPYFSVLTEESFSCFPVVETKAGL